jgi:hypothetical protein
MRRVIPLIPALLLAAGCGPKAVRIDATTDATAEASIDAMREGLTEDQKERLQSDMKALTMPVMMGALLKEPPEGGRLTARDLARPLHGLTAAEIHDKAQARRAATDAARAKRGDPDGRRRAGG